MSTQLTNSIKLQLDAKLAEQGNLNVLEAKTQINVNETLVDATKCYAEIITLGASESQTLDLTDLIDPLGNSVNFGNVNAVYINNGSSDGILSIGGTDQFTLLPSGSLDLPSGSHIMFFDPAGISVTGAGDNQISLTADGSGATVQVVVLGK